MNPLTLKSQKVVPCRSGVDCGFWDKSRIDYIYFYFVVLIYSVKRVW